jgi:hypothetical protein
MLSRLSATDVNQQDDADERDRTGDADHTICAYASTKKSYFQSLGLRHGIISIRFRLACRADVAIGAIFTVADNGNLAKN